MIVQVVHHNQLNLKNKFMGLILGQEIVIGVTKNPNKYNNATLLEVLSGHTYQGNGEVTNNGRLLRVRAFKGVSLFGRTQFEYVQWMQRFRN